MDDHYPLSELPTRAAWQRSLAEAITRPAELLDVLGLDPTLPALDGSPLRDFPLRVPRAFVARMRHGDARDPLFLQVWPASLEQQQTPGFS
ncbi:MAG: epmB, partial [Nevskia sp.]|nr:epmB [Nevskia sp.]